MYRNLARMYTTTTGTGNVTLTTVVPGCKSFADVCSDSGVYEYGMITYDLSTHRPIGSECGIGKYISSGTVFQRNTIENSTDSDDSAIDLTGLSEIYLTPIASSFNSGFNPFAVYYYNGTDTINNTVTDTQLSIDTEWVDTNNVATVGSNTVTVAEDGWYEIGAIVEYSGGAAFNGFVSIIIEAGIYTLTNTKGYVVTWAITDDTNNLVVSFPLSAGNTIKVKASNISGTNLDFFVYELVVKKVLYQ